MATRPPVTDLGLRPWCDPVLLLERALVTPHDDRVLLRASGELDVTTASSLLAQLTALAEDGAAQVDLDLGGVRSCDGAGLAVLLEGRRRIAERGGTLTVHDPCPSLRRILDLCDLTLDLEARAPTTTGGWGRGARPRSAARTG